MGNLGWLTAAVFAWGSQGGDDVHLGDEGCWRKHKGGAFLLRRRLRRREGGVDECKVKQMLEAGLAGFG